MYQRRHTNNHQASKARISYVVTVARFFCSHDPISGLADCVCVLVALVLLLESSRRCTLLARTNNDQQQQQQQQQKCGSTRLAGRCHCSWLFDGTERIPCDGGIVDHQLRHPNGRCTHACLPLAPLSRGTVDAPDFGACGFCSEARGGKFDGLVIPVQSARFVV
jgi:hypothetical protein